MNTPISVEEDYLDCSLPPLSPSSLDLNTIDSSHQNYRVPDILDYQQTSALAPIKTISTQPTCKDEKSMADISQQQSTGFTVEKTREDLMSEIEKTIIQMIHSIMVGEPIQLALVSRKQSKSQPLLKKKKSTHDTVAMNEMIEGKRVLSLTSGSAAKTLARYISILQMIYEAVSYEIIVTKRDMFYRDVVLFGKQTVTAASKGLVFGPIKIILKNGKVLDCMTTSTQQTDTLIPPISQIAEIQCKAKCIVIIEKEATFRYLVSVGFHHSLQIQQDCILITGKGYPDLSTRQLVKYLSVHFCEKPILALMDNDPHGLDIYATYKWGARAMAFDVLNLAVNSVQLIGLSCKDRIDYGIPVESWVPMTDRDRIKCAAMVRTLSRDETPGESQLVERGWKDKLDIHLSSQGHQAYIQE
ncbi:Spo11/DNA topoisomerase VI subunit A, partial [Blakeslea trispora]